MYVPFLCTKKRYVRTISSYKETVHMYSFFVQSTYRFFVQKNGTYVPFLCTKKRYVPFVHTFLCTKYVLFLRTKNGTYVPFLCTKTYVPFVHTFLCTKKRYVRTVSFFVRSTYHFFVQRNGTYLQRNGTYQSFLSSNFHQMSVVSCYIHSRHLMLVPHNAQ